MSIPFTFHSFGISLSPSHCSMQTLKTPSQEVAAFESNTFLAMSQLLGLALVVCCALSSAFAQIGMVGGWTTVTDLNDPTIVSLAQEVRAWFRQTSTCEQQPGNATCQAVATMNRRPTAFLTPIGIVHSQQTVVLDKILSAQTQVRCSLHACMHAGPSEDGKCFSPPTPPMSMRSSHATGSGRHQL